jgi:hypothetical protein
VGVEPNKVEELVGGAAIGLLNILPEVNPTDGVG